MADEASPGNGPKATPLFPDHPVRDGKVAFEFDGFARTLAGLVLSPDNRTPFTVVVKGEWGRGKTTLLEETRRILTEWGSDAKAGQSGYRCVRTLWFNAWKYPREDSVLAGLLGALLDELRRRDFWDQFKLWVNDYKESAAWAVLRAAFPALFDSEGKPAGRFEKVEENRAFYDVFEELFQELSYAWFEPPLSSLRDLFGKKLDGRRAVVAVFLDDLDRCDDDRVIEVLKAINLFLDMSGVCFYLGLNWERLKEVLKKKTEGREEEFLEKIVQIAMELPQISPQGIEAYMEKMVEGTPLESARPHLPILAKRAVSRNPRHAKRFLNDLSLRLGLLENTGRLGAAEEQLPKEAVIAWHVLAEVVPSRWDHLKRGRTDLDVFLDGYERWRAAEEKKAEAGREEDEALFRDSDVQALLEPLRALNPAQRNLLVHHGSPMREVVTVSKLAERVGPVGAEIEWVTIPAGPFDMGSADGDEDERPVRPVSLGEYRISRYPITNRQYEAYVRDAKAKSPAHWKDGKVPDGKEDHPVVHVSWNDAVAYCRWKSEQTGAVYRLPTEAEWEKAARGTDGRTWPWGDQFDQAKCNTREGGRGETTPVTEFPEGGSPYGCYDMAGNVWEWTNSLYKPYPYEPDDGREDPNAEGRRVLRGGSWRYTAYYARSAYRLRDTPDGRDDDFGFRCVVAPRGSPPK
jgi:formylglycine-generating enzyme required for sulfatase activity